MENILFINRQSIVKVCVVWMLGLAVLLGSSAVTLGTANAGYAVGDVICLCDCVGAGPTGGNTWLKKYACGLANGNDCTSIGILTLKPMRGKLKNCKECTVVEGGWVACGNSKYSGTRPPALGDELQIAPPMPQPPKLPKTEVPLSGIQQRGIEGEKAAEPPASAPAGQKDKATTPK